MNRARGLVAAQLLLLAALVLIPRGALWPIGAVASRWPSCSSLLGAALAVLGAVGLGPALTASPIPRQGAGLVTRGVYGVCPQSDLHRTSGRRAGAGRRSVPRSGTSSPGWRSWRCSPGRRAGRNGCCAPQHPEFDDYAARGRPLPAGDRPTASTPLTSMTARRPPSPVPAAFIIQDAVWLVGRM